MFSKPKPSAQDNYLFFKLRNAQLSRVHWIKTSWKGMEIHNTSIWNYVDSRQVLTHLNEFGAGWVGIFAKTFGSSYQCYKYR